MTKKKISQIRKELANAGGRLEWQTEMTLVGVSFLSLTDRALTRLPTTLMAAAWINFEGTEITDKGLKLLEQCTVLESVRLVNCERVTAAGVESFLKLVPSVVQIALADGQLKSRQLRRIRALYPRICINLVTENDPLGTMLP